MNWIVVRSHPNRENFAVEHCVKQGYVVFLPRILEFAGHGSQRNAIAKPLFPTYLFVGIEARWRPLLSTFGVRSVILHGDSPAFVRLSIIEELRERQDRDGLITLPQRKRGDHVEIARGTFAGHAGIYLGMPARDRVRVLLSLLGGGGRATLLVAERDLAPASP
jgi:transcriptional antiterminator RfaH